MHARFSPSLFNGATLVQLPGLITGSSRGSFRSGCSRCHGEARDGRAHSRSNSGQAATGDSSSKAAAAGSRSAWLSPPRDSWKRLFRCRSTAGTCRVVLQPAPFFEAVNVTSSRTDLPRADPSVTMTVFPASELLTSAALTLDDALKMVPGFTLFRRTSSRVSNPTAQGVTLRGLGGTGASRSLVLADGVPLNDAFGGWVYWDKVPQVAIDRVEVLRGSGSDLYGADAVGGVVQILTCAPEPARRPRVGRRRRSQDRPHLDVWRRSLRRLELHGRWRMVHDEGYIPVALEQDPGIAPRGPIDSKAGSKHQSAVASIEYQGGNGWRFNARGNVFTENRRNGTPAVINDTASRQGTGEAAGGIGRRAPFCACLCRHARLRSDLLRGIAGSDD